MHATTTTTMIDDGESERKSLSVVHRLYSYKGTSERRIEDRQQRIYPPRRRRRRTMAAAKEKSIAPACDASDVVHSPADA